MCQCVCVFVCLYVQCVSVFVCLSVRVWSLSVSLMYCKYVCVFLYIRNIIISQYHIAGNFERLNF